MLTIDLNCDMGEGMPHDPALMPFISSANIACGGHAGNDNTMRTTVELALKNGVAIGAHPSYNDPENFGRRDLIGISLRADDIPSIIFEQIDRLRNICIEFGTTLHHVKPHGALYNRAAKDPELSNLICKTIYQIDPSLFLYGLSDSILKKEAASFPIKFINEVFADRTYQESGLLTPRTDAHALIESDEKAMQQVIQIVKTGSVTALNGKKIFLSADTICVHGDGRKALEFARLINTTLKNEKIQIAAPSFVK